ncbi:MAG: ATP-binding cassette domain-containing protein, partial [Candidatus Lokiarchaeota archaeon]|nr:ATP-binding cassette domain-containing protein [Candidatus Lokiarchaeota archaeon]
VTALRGANLKINRGAFRMILGPSGSGKSTLLNVLGGLDSATSGEIYVSIDGEFRNIAKFSKSELALYRRRHLGFVFQFYNLIPILTALENVELAARFSQIEEPKKKSIEFLEKLGIGDKLDRYPSQLSGGEQQRVAVARALVKSPALILADEPSGNLDSKNSDEIYHLLKNLSEEFKKTILIVTHDEDMADKYAKDHIYIRDGKIFEDEETAYKIIYEE